MSGTGDGARPASDTTVLETPAVCCFLLTLSGTVTVVFPYTTLFRSKVTLIVQVALAAKVEGLRGQLLVCPKSPGLVPVKPMLVMVSAVAVGFESVTT